MAQELAARDIVVTGRVQGVGYRPFVYRLARQLALKGWVRNNTGEVQIHVEGAAPALSRFETGLIAEAPPLARAQLKSSAEVPTQGLADFRILHSEANAPLSAHLPPDLFCCDDCLRELRDPAQRRHRYAFTNCTQCGPRYTIIERLPYDRPSTSMAAFPLCPDCRREYEDPGDRRFHAQPLACPTCGPTLTLHHGQRRLRGDEALSATIALLRDGAIVAVKGIGGYHLMCDAGNDQAVATLRARKRRPAKPLAVMFPMAGADGLDAVRASVDIDDVEAGALADPQRPIVVVRRSRACTLSTALAPGLGELGVFLPYSPLHALLLDGFGGPLVATSGNISGEPVITDNGEAESRLGVIADAFLHHDRPIVRPADDSVLRAIARRARPIRLGRGMAPVEIDLPARLPEPVLAVGGHLKNTVALAWDKRVVMSPHIGELDSPRSMDVFAAVIADLQRLYGIDARHVVCDAHPNYASARWARTQPRPVTTVQHHVAHASALAGEHPQVSRWLVFAWDGIGYGSDGHMWGGEAFAGAPGAWTRVASLRPFRLAGGDLAGRQPWRAAAALMWESGLPFLPRVEQAALAREAWHKNINTAVTSSVGRLFDAAASLILGVEAASFEGQGPMQLESAAGATDESIELPLAQDAHGLLRFDWAPLLPMLADSARAAPLRARIFHNSLADVLAAQVARLAATLPFDAVGLTGGVFQNRLLSELVAERLERQGIRSCWSDMVPPNDGGLAFGQITEILGSTRHT